jgi:uncharacterized protein (DUF58 family)
MKLKFRRRLSFTREGKYFVALTIGIGFAAINTGNNLLYLVLGMMLAFIIGSGVLSEISLNALEVERRIPDRLYTGRPFLMGINLRNAKQRFPSFSIEVEDLQAGRSLDKKCYFLKVPAGRTQRTSYRHTFASRGLYSFTGFTVSTKFPFALFRKSRLAVCDDEVVVYPAVYPLLPPAGGAADMGEQMTGRLDRRGDFYALRDYLPGDDPRDIYWRKTARTGRMVIRQHEEHHGRRMAVFLDNHQRQEVLSPEDLEQQERAVSQAASLAAHYVRQGYVVALVTRTNSVGAGSGQAHLTKILHTLALLAFISEERAFTAPARWSGECIFVGPRGATVTGSGIARQARQSRRGSGPGTRAA